MSECESQSTINITFQFFSSSVSFPGGSSALVLIHMLFCVF